MKKQDNNQEQNLDQDDDCPYCGQNEKRCQKTNCGLTNSKPKKKFSFEDD